MADIRTQVPEDTQAVDVIATAPGFGARIVRLNAPGEEGFGADIELQPPGGFLSLEFPSPEKGVLVPDGELRLSVLDLPSVQEALEKEGVVE